MSERVPVVVLGGWLGSGKTTLVNHLLRHAGGRRIAVLVNDFGETSIDADLIEGEADAVLSLAGGCVCCSYGADLVGTLAQAVQRRPDVVLLECSGVGLPAAVARSARLVAGARVDGIVVVADAGTVQAQAADAYVGDVVRQQLEQADLLLLNKAGTLTDGARAALEAWWPSAAPRVFAERAQVAPEVVLGVRPDPSPEPFTPRAALPAAQAFESACREGVAPQDPAALGRTLAAQRGVLRAKGVLLDPAGRACTLHVVGQRVDVAPAPPGARPGRLVLIALKGHAEEALAAAGLGAFGSRTG